MSTSTASALDLLSHSGPIARALPGYEPRPQQLAMAEKVAEAFSVHKHLLVEAGTGVGKSFAYLVPAVAHVAANGGCVVVSTHTIALQEQLIYKDIPFLQKALGINFRAELVKGRSNYVSLRRLTRASQRQAQLLLDQDRAQLWEIEDWAKVTQDGSLSDMPRQPAPDAWDLARSDRNDCMGRKCPLFGSCFFQRARRKLAKAQILVVNHALLFTDLALNEAGAGILPDYDLVVLDEAHTVESVAGDHFGASLAETQLNFLLSGLYNDRTGRGALACAPADAAIPAVREVRHAVQDYFQALMRFRQERPAWNGRLVEPPPVEQRISGSLLSLHESLRKVHNDLDDEDARFELNGKMDQCTEYARVVSTLHGLKQEGFVYWLEETERRRRPSIMFSGRPIDVGPALQRCLFSAKKSVVLTSATLTTAAKEPFGYIRSRLALNEADGVALGSPFDFRQQATIYVEDDLPEPASDLFLPAACERMKKYLHMTQARAFVLFTAYTMMEQCASRMEGFFAEQQMRLLVQGRDKSRSQMLATFKSEPRCVLFGTDTFWQGVDVPGSALSNVIIVKLPFGVPTHPTIEARIELIRARGGNPFNDFQLPEAILKFKQGFGRLIRTKTDRGIVVILDPRVRSKPYGRRFLAALPECRMVWASEEGPGAA